MEEDPKTKLDKAMAAVKEAARKLTGEKDSGPVPVETPSEDAFIPPEGEIKHEGPPKDPNVPSGSLSSDDEEAVPVDFRPRRRRIPDRKLVGPPMNFGRSLSGLFYGRSTNR
jgi:hypothetical protein